MHKASPVIKVINSAFANEIANEFQYTQHSLTVTLPNADKVVIVAPLTTAPTQASTQPFFVTPLPKHTYHYLHQPHPARFTLQSVEDCRAYVDDICRTKLNASITDNEVKFADGSTFLIIIRTH